MVIRTALIAGTVLAALLVPLAVKEVQSVAVSFDDSASDRLVIAAPQYHLAFNKANGAFLSISDAHSTEISQGSSGGCLWGAVLSGNPNYLGGCSFSPKGPNTFSYSWDAGSDTLTLRYAGDAGTAQHMDATVTITAGTGSSFDMHLTLANHTGSTVRNALFPSDLLFRTTAVQSGYLPYYLPGVRVKPAFFSEDHSNVPTYPGGSAFADYLALDVAGSHVALYSVNGAPHPIQPVALGFIHNAAGTACQGASFCATHSFQTWVADGGTWTSPPVRIVVGETTPTTIAAYRHDNGVDAYPSVADKLGTHFVQYARAPLIKADAAAVSVPFRSWIPLLAALPAPSLLHPVAYMLGGHDHSYPDFLPPDPTWGSSRDFAAMVHAAQTAGMVVMPYTNPTWWTDDSRTLAHLPAPLTVADISVLDESKSPVHEVYGPNGGYDASPYVPFVQDRIAQEMAQWQSTVPVDCVFEDQIGARAWMLDLNPHSPSPLDYSQGWLDHTTRYQKQCLMTENGWDRLAATEVGFNGSLLTWERAFKDPDQFFGAGNWEAYPLALYLLHDKVLLYQHDLALETMSNQPGVLTWNMAFGIMLSYNWGGSGKAWQNVPWLNLITWLQRDVAALYAGQPLTSYTTVAPQVTETRFPAVRITANWNTKTAHTVQGTGIAPGGFLAQAEDGSVVAGMFTGRFNGYPLSRGTHYLVVERGNGQTVVRQPIGPNTTVSVKLPSAVSARHAGVTAYDAKGRALGMVKAAVRSGNIRFLYASKLGSKAVAYYRVWAARHG